MKGLKVVITMPEMMEQMDISDKTIHRMIEEGELPDFTYGSRVSKKKGWHTAVLERHAMEKYEKSNSLKNLSNIAQVRGKDMAIVPLSCNNTTMTKKNGNFDNRNTAKKKLSSKEMPGRMRSATGKSRIAAGFADMPAQNVS